MHHPLTVYGLSDKGLVRQNNEDVWGQVQNKQFFVLADGMGGHQAGEVAASLAVESSCSYIEKEWDSTLYDVEQGAAFVEKAIQFANTIVYDQSLQKPECRGMGTTLCCLLFHSKSVIYAHVGDSRIYRFNNGTLTQLTKDDSLLRQMQELGIENNLNHCKHILTKAVGTDSTVNPSFGVLPLLPDDLFLMCTDGLTDLLSNSEIEAIVTENPPDAIASQLIEIAKARGGHDNITIVIAKVNETYLPR